ncbi:hypothetical protein PR048_008197 [Dryococelus australis]|uniref:PiggyBac transposable element-derived protein domain-containing protein n=1 Tax=Dryococelus australis TaxID=614101 RepID=A0ABQ9HWF4_9NEOP|nr:hypothetical protein PR048_008197 [Dryococelus australis]
MSRDRFLLTMGALHFAKNPEARKPKPDDRLYKIRAVLNIFNTSMSEVYYWRGRLSFRQYVKNKRHKYGIKVYMLNNPDGFINKCAMYTGMLDDSGRGKGYSEKVVLNLLQDKLNAGHHVYMDNYYNSFGLAKTQLYQKTHY